MAIDTRNAPEPSPPPEKTIWRNPLVYTSLLLLVVAAYVGWILYSRHAANQEYDRRAAEERARKQHESDQAAIEQLGGSELAIQMLYATPKIERGGVAQICYGVANAASVTLTPQDNPVWPSHSLCVDVKPARTTTYTLTATGKDGKTVSQQVTVAVH
ncbi:MAG TPA: hypothetical protein VMT51_10925 [Dongiaceae bacterium]|nr:hypothetical protein [Dongiaceae bacterium]